MNFQSNAAPREVRWLLALWLVGAGFTAPATSHAHAPAHPSALSQAISQPENHATPEMLQGVQTIDAPGLPGPIAVFGEDAFAVVTPKGKPQNASKTKPAQAVVAAANWGRGRVVVFGHGGFLTSTGHDTPRLLANAARWCAPGDGALRVWGATDAIREALAANGIRVESAQGDWREHLGDLDLLVLDTHHLEAQADREAVRTFVVDQGGGWMTAGLAWGWLQLHPGKIITDHPGNKILWEAGLAFADGTVAESPGDLYEVAPEPSPWAHAGRAVEALVHGTISADERAAAGASVAAAMRTLGRDHNPLRDRLAEVLEGDRESFDGLYREMHAHGLTWKDHTLARLGIVEFMLDSFEAPPEAVVKHPSADGFPGRVDDEAPRSVRTATVDTTIPGWRCTGFYAPAGEVVTLHFAEDLSGRGLVVQIGSHLDPESRGALNRLPRVVRRFGVDAPSVRVANPVGGLIYLDVPKGFAADSVAMSIEGAVASPLFTLGHTSAEQWETLREAPGPWAELESKEIALTVPSEVVRTLDDPASLMEFWNKVVRTQGHLEPRRLNGLGDRQARLVPDISVSWGYMYAPANRPLTIPMSSAADLVDLDGLLDQDGGNVWGFFHELGHWHQNSMWTFGGTGEVTVNLFTLYALDKVCGIAPSEARNFTPEKMLGDMRAHAAAGSPFEVWKRKPFLALTMYVQLQQAFGWALYEDVFAEYRALPESERPKSDADKRDQWLVRTSRYTGRDLGPFFEAWGVPTSESARASVSDLPGWMPEGW